MAMKPGRFWFSLPRPYVTQAPMLGGGAGVVLGEEGGQAQRAEAGADALKQVAAGKTEVRKVRHRRSSGTDQGREARRAVKAACSGEANPCRRTSSRRALSRRSKAA